jgi:hypothetical protein
MSTIEKLGKYVIRGVLGKGAMGLVYRAYDPFLEREVALKTMMEQISAGDTTAKDRFYREAKAAAKLKHKHIVTIYDMGEEEGTPYIAMEIIEGTVLSSLMKQQESMSLEQKLTIVRGVAEGLDFAHRGGVVHRDIKPANISVDTRDYSPKIMDFGIAKVAASDMTKTGMILGTINYMSPEQLKADKHLDGRSDLFAVGVILYELLLQKKPFTGDTITAVMYKIVHDAPEDLTALAKKYPSPIVELVKKALAKNRDERYQTGGEFAADITRVLEALKKGTLDELKLEIAQSEVTMDFDANATQAAGGGATQSHTQVAGSRTVGGATGTSASTGLAGGGGLTGQTHMQGGTGAQSLGGQSLGGQTVGGGTGQTMGAGTQATMAPGSPQGMTPGGTQVTMGVGSQFGTQLPQKKKSSGGLIAGVGAVVAIAAAAGWWFTRKPVTPVGTPTGPATISVQVFPWAKVVSLTDSASHKPVANVIPAGDTTPLNFELPPGDYELVVAVGGDDKNTKTIPIKAETGKVTPIILNGGDAGTEGELNKLLAGTDEKK